MYLNETVFFSLSKEDKVHYYNHSHFKQSHTNKYILLADKQRI